MPSKSALKASATSSTTANPATVLFVDDEEHLRELMKVYFEIQDVPVVTAANGVEALGLFNNPGNRIRVVVTDENMPGMNGHTLIHEIRRVDESIPIIVASANIPVELQREGSGVTCVWKPYLASELADAIQQVLAAQERNHHNLQQQKSR